MSNIEAIAREKIQKKKDFYRHFRAYLIVSVMIILANLIPFFIKWWGSYPDAPLSEVLEELFFYYPYWYVQYPIIGWGIAVFVHFLTVFGFGKHLDNWEERTLRRAIEKQQQAENEIGDEELELKEIERVTMTHKKWNDTDLV